MKIGMTLLARDEIDIIRPWLDWHLPRVDFCIVTDNGSVDGTREVLAEYPVTVIDEPGRDYRQDVWVDRMIRACIDRGAGWVVNSDVDEFWRGDIRETIGKLGGKGNVIRVQSKNYRVTHADDPKEPNPIKRIQHHAGVNPIWAKVFFNAAGFDRNYLGNHKVFFKPGTPQKVVDADLTDLQIAHFNERSWPQFRRKYIQGGEAYAKNPLHCDPSYGPHVGWHWKEKYKIYTTGAIEALRCAWEKSIADPSRLIHEPL